MYRLLAALLVLTLAACEAPTVLGPDGQPAPKPYFIKPRQAEKVRGRMLEQVNLLRAEAGLAPLTLDPALTQAAAEHAADMARQQRPWHWGSDGSSPYDRVRRAGYQGLFLGELLSESYEDEVATVRAWATEDPATRAVLLDPNARDVGIAWYQEPNAKLWWVLVTGTPFVGGNATQPPAAIRAE